jgi:hypothetical protein
MSDWTSNPEGNMANTSLKCRALLEWVPGLGCDECTITPVPQRTPDDPFTCPVAVRIGRVEEANSEVDRHVNQTDAAPHPTGRWMAQLDAPESELLGTGDPNHTPA